MACLRTAVKLLDRLQLKSADVSNSADETLHVVSSLFKRYADRLMSCMDRSKVDPAVCSLLLGFTSLLLMHC